MFQRISIFIVQVEVLPVELIEVKNLASLYLKVFVTIKKVILTRRLRQVIVHLMLKKKKKITISNDEPGSWSIRLGHLRGASRAGSGWCRSERGQRDLLSRCGGVFGYLELVFTVL